MQALRVPLRRSVLASAPIRPAMSLRRTAARPFNYTTSSSPPPPKSSNRALFIGVGVAVAAGAAAWVFTSSSPNAREAATAVKGKAQTAKAKANYVPSKEDYQKVYNRVAEIIDEADEYDDGSYGPVILRLAWHCSGTYDKNTKTGGSNFATMRFEPEALHPANSGLHVARALVEKVKGEFSWISYGDLWTLAGVAAIQEMAGPKIPWRPGRIDGFDKDVTPDGRLPDATQSQDHLRAIFYRMGFNDQEIVALSGAHALGRCHKDRSGFDGPWTFSPTTMTNDYFKLLLEEKWTWRKWAGPKQLADKKTGTLMMLPTDYSLIRDKSFRKYAQAYAQDQDVFFKDFSAAFSRLLELGVPESQFAGEPWFMKTVDEQGEKN